MKLGDLHNWLQIKNCFSSRRTNEHYIIDSFKRYKTLLNNLDLTIIDLDKLYTQYCLFVSMYSIKSFKIKHHTPFVHDKDLKALDSFGTLYGEMLIDFIVNEQEYFKQFGIDILQKKTNSLFLEFIVFTLKQIDLEDIQNLL